MREDYPAEHRRVGPLIKAHRESLGVTLRELIEGYGAGCDQIVKFVEKSDKPALTLIERYHYALMVVWADAEGRVDMQRARAEQWWATDEDVLLWGKAQAGNAAVSWWWGMRRDISPRGAWCHICNQIIHRYDVARGLRRPGRYAVMAHRFEHISELRAAQSTRKRKGSK